MPHTDSPPAAGPVASAVTTGTTTGSGDDVPPRPGSTTFLRAAVRPRMVVLLVVLLGAAAVCGRLGAWQIDRAESRGASAAAHVLAEHEQVAPVGIGTVLAPQTTFTGALVGRQVQARGVYDAADQLLVRDRALDGRTGFLVLTPLRVTDEDPAAGAVPTDAAGPAGTTDAVAPPGSPVLAPPGSPVLAVVRGWVGSAADAAALAVPSGEVTVTGYLQAAEGPGSGLLPGGQIDTISAADLVNVWGGPIWTGYVALVVSEPAQQPGLAPVPPPTRDGAGLNLQNLAYAAQWWIFGGFALFLWSRLVRDEASGQWPEDARPRADGGPGRPPADAQA